MRNLKKIVTSVTAGLCCSGYAGEPIHNNLNIVFVLCDDLGWKDLNCYGGTVFKTPNIDRLAAKGMRFTDAYSACSVCTPSRISLITGQYPGRQHYETLKWFLDFFGNVEKSPTEIKLIQPQITEEDCIENKPSEYPFPRAFRDAGYRTALFGKADFGCKDEYVKALGFDVYDPVPNDVSTEPTIVDKNPKQMMTITDLSIRFMHDCQTENKPFFLYVAHLAPHIRVQATQAYYDECMKRMSNEEKKLYSPYYVAMVDELDSEIGRLLKELDDMGIAENTAIVFTSDNGGVDTIFGKGYKLTSMAPLRGEKGGQYEGGDRVPLIVKWPGKVSPGTVSDAVVVTPDFYPTCLTMAGISLPAQQILDGTNFVSVLEGATSLDRAAYWHKPHYMPGVGPFSMIRDGRYKYILYWENKLSPDGGPPDELFDLNSDIGEKNNIIDKYPEVAARLKETLLQHLKETGCRLPEVNPQYLPPGGKAKPSGEKSKNLAGWTKLDDFESYVANNDIRGANGWADADQTISLSAKAVANPNGDGKVLEFKKTGAAVGTANLVNSGSGFTAKTHDAPQTVYLRFMFSGSSGLKGALKEFSGIGVTAKIGGDDYREIKQGFVINDSDDDNDADDLISPSGTAAGLRLLPDVWYNAWLVTDHMPPESAKLYLQSTDDSRFVEQKEVKVDGGWIAGPGAAPYTVFAMMANHSSGPTMYVDDIYYDNRGEDLTVPPHVVAPVK